MTQSCFHVPKCNNEVDKNTDKFAICPGLNFVTKKKKKKTFVKHSQMNSKQGPEWDYKYYIIAKFAINRIILRPFNSVKLKTSKMRFKEGPKRKEDPLMSRKFQAYFWYITIFIHNSQTMYPSTVKINQYNLHTSSYKVKKIVSKGAHNLSKKKITSTYISIIYANLFYIRYSKWPTESCMTKC